MAGSGAALIRRSSCSHAAGARQAMVQDGHHDDVHKNLVELQRERILSAMDIFLYPKGHFQAWEHDRNLQATSPNWQFTTQDARIKLKRLYPSFDD